MCARLGRHHFDFGLREKMAVTKGKQPHGSRLQPYLTHVNCRTFSKEYISTAILGAFMLLHHLSLRLYHQDRPGFTPVEVWNRGLGIANGLRK